jgi:hypothetical protein
MSLYSILVTTTGHPPLGSSHVIRHAERFWIGCVVSATPGPVSVMPSWAVTWQVDATVGAAQADAMARNRNVFVLDARETPEDARRWHEIDEAHWRAKGYAPNHWSGL